MIIITITYPAHRERPAYSKEFKFDDMPSERVGSYLAKKQGQGLITRIIVSNKGTVIWDSDRNEDWF